MKLFTVNDLIPATLNALRNTIKKLSFKCLPVTQYAY